MENATYTDYSAQNGLENLAASESRINGIAEAKAMMGLAKSGFERQAEAAMLTHANHAPQSVINLLRQ